MFMQIAVLAAVFCMGYKFVKGRWPWEKTLSTRQQAVFRAQQLLGLEAGAGRDDILAAHKRLVAVVHPDRGGTNDQVYEANAARDLLLDELPGRLNN